MQELTDPPNRVWGLEGLWTAHFNWQNDAVWAIALVTVVIFSFASGWNERA